ncbi:MAG: ABC transporter ATP-binding protein/permease [Candidatus Omnitrophota bacterium]
MKTHNDMEAIQKPFNIFFSLFALLRKGCQITAAKLKYIAYLIVTSPNYRWVIFFQIVSSLASFIGLPILIPVLEFMQEKSFAADSTSYLKVIAVPLKFLGIDLTFHSVLLTAGVLILIGQALVFLSSLIATFAKEELLLKYREKVIKAYADADWLWLTDKHSGGMYYAIIREAQFASECNLNAQRVFINFVQVITFLGIAMKLSFIVTMTATVVYAFLLLVSALISNRVLKVAESYNENYKKLSNDIIGFQQNKKFFKASVLSGKLTDAISLIVGNLCRQIKRQSVLIEIQRSWSVLGTSLFLIGLLFFHQQLSLNYATLLLILFVFLRIAPQFVALSDIYAALDSNIPMHKSLQKHLRDLDEHKEKSGSKKFFCDQPIVFQDVHFAYPSGQQVLTGLNFSIKPKTTVAFVGSSGVGKSTMLDLLLGLIQPNQGAIYYGDIRHDELDKNLFRNGVAYVNQQPSLLDGTIKENLTIGASSVTDEVILDVCRKVRIDQFVDQLPQGLNTLIGENGIKLSGGQRQRLVLGRSLFMKPKILILDEATSELDLESEAMIQSTISELKKELTIIMVAHRLSTVKLADMIYVIDDGKVCESGSYQQLLERKGKFHYLDSLQ